MSAKPKVGSEKPKAAARHNARLAAVQALYQMEISNRGAKGVIREFLEQRLAQPSEFFPDVQVDKTLFVKLVEQVVQNQSDIDKAIRLKLSGSWRLSRIDRTLRAILRCGCCELLFDSHAPHAVVLDEYVQIASAFFDKKETAFINATLDSILHDPALLKKRHE